MTIIAGGIAYLTMADSASTAGLNGVDTDAYGGYDNGKYVDIAPIEAAHPGRKYVDFSVFLANTGMAGDDEAGDMTDAEMVSWLAERLAAKVWRPVGYKSISSMGSLVAAWTAAGHARSSYRLLSAHYNWGGQLPGLARGQHICGPATCGGVQCDGTQWIDHGPWDESLLMPDFFDATVTPPVIVTPPSSGPTFPSGAAVTTPTTVDAAHTPSGKGYWEVRSDGSVFSYGDAQYKGGANTAGPLNAPIVGIAAHPSGDGYWLVGADGGIFSYGSVGYYGSAGGTKLNAPIIRIMATPTGNGYWLIASDGGVFAYGDAVFEGSDA